MPVNVRVAALCVCINGNRNNGRKRVTRGNQYSVKRLVT